MQPNQSTSPNDEFSPFAVAQNLVRQLFDKEITTTDFTDALERYLNHVAGWSENLESIQLPDSDEAQESRVLLEGSLQGIDLILQGAESLGQLAQETTHEVAEQGLQAIFEGQKLLRQVQEITDANITSAIDDARYMD